MSLVFDSPRMYGCIIPRRSKIMNYQEHHLNVWYVCIKVANIFRTSFTFLLCVYQTHTAYKNIVYSPVISVHALWKD